jgi:hypothetical protein
MYSHSPPDLGPMVEEKRSVGVLYVEPVDPATCGGSITGAAEDPRSIIPTDIWIMG